MQHGAQRNINYTRDFPLNSTDLKLESDSMILENATEMYDLNVTERNYEDFRNYEQQQKFYINMYTILIVGSVILNTGRSLLFFKLTMRASKGLHDTMFNNILQATMRFFDTNPSGK